MKIYVVRHGSTGMNKEHIVNGELDEPLLAEGIAEAQDAATGIADTVATIYSSPLQRATQTASVFASLRTIPILVDDSLSEIKMGKLAGNPWTAMPDGEILKQRHRSISFDYTPYGGETVDEVVNRLKDFLRDIDTKHKNGEVLLVTHGGVIRVLQYLESGKPIYETEKNIVIVEFDTDKLLSSK